jgi:hypothetical protein
MSVVLIELKLTKGILLKNRIRQDVFVARRKCKRMKKNKMQGVPRISAGELQYL